MKSTKNLTKDNIILGLLLVVFILLGYLGYNIFTKQNGDDVDKTLKCNQLYELKKEKYFGTLIGQSKAIYSSKFDTCLALNLCSDICSGDNAGKFVGMVVDMSDDKTLLYYKSIKKGSYYDENDKEVVCGNTIWDEYNYLNYWKGDKEIVEEGCQDMWSKMINIIKSDFGFEVN